MAAGSVEVAKSRAVRVKLSLTSDAIPEYRRATELDPHSPVAWESLGKACKSNDRAGDAIPHGVLMGGWVLQSEFAFESRGRIGGDPDFEFAGFGDQFSGGIVIGQIVRFERESYAFGLAGLK